DIRVEQIEERSAWDAQAQPGYGLLHRRGVIFLGVLYAGGVELVVTGQHVEHESGILDRPHNRTAMIERERERNNAADGDEPVGRFQSNHSAIGRGYSDGAAGVRAESAKTTAGRHCR